MKLRSQLKKNLFLVFFIAALLMLFFYQERKHYDLISDKDLNIIHDKLKVLSLQEKKDLAYFFNHALIFCEFPYTLVASKPMSICNYLQASEDLPQILREDYERPIHREFADKLERGYQVFDKYNSLFPLKNYIILRYHASNSKGMNEFFLL